MKVGIREKILMLILATVFLGSFALGMVFYLFASNNLWRGVEQRAFATVAAGALAIDGDLHEQIQSPEDRKTKAYRELQDTLNIIRQAGSVTYVYTMRKVDSRHHHLIVDGDTGELEVPYGTVYENHLAVNLVYDEGLPAVRDALFYEEGFGWLMTVLAPIRNNQGEVVAMLGVDVAVDEIRQQQYVILLWIFGISFLCSVIFSLIAYKIAGKIIAPIVGVTESIDAISEAIQGTDPELIEEALSAEDVYRKHGQWLPEKMLDRQDETGTLSRSFTRMKDQLKDTFKLLTEKSEENEAYRQELVAQLEENENLLIKIRENYMATVQALANAIEAMDDYTEGHCERVSEYAMKIARHVGLDVDTSYLLEVAARLHDIGKIAVPTEVLNKQGRLTTVEMEIVKQHPKVGHDILAQIPGMERSREMILQHHERYDGKGYPQGFAGKGIEQCAHILAIADSFDAMTSVRPYRRIPLSNAEAIVELEAHAGTQFDPEIVAALIEILRQEGVK